MRPIQLTPFEVQSSYGGTVAGRHNLDVQDMRRVLDSALWLGARDCLPQIGGLAPQLGHMSRFEWNGTAYEGRSTSSPVPVSWISRRQLAAGFREDWLRAHEGEKMEDPLAAAKQISTASSESSSEDEDLDFDKAIRCGVSEAFADGINSVSMSTVARLMMLIVFNACSAARYHTSCLCVCSGSGYQTKPNPGLGGMMEELRRGWTNLHLSLHRVGRSFFFVWNFQPRLPVGACPTGIERLEQERQAREKLRAVEAEQARAAGLPVPRRRGVLFSETLKTLTRLSSSYRRCHWKSGAEVIFPLLYGHLTYASHRTWKLYTKKAIFFAWRHGDAAGETACCEVALRMAKKASRWCFAGRASMIWFSVAGAKWNPQTS